MHRLLQIGIAVSTLNQVRALALATISVSFTLLGSSAAEAACANWDLTNQTLWGAGQTNGYTLGLTFKQSGGNLWGDGYYFGHRTARARYIERQHQWKRIPVHYDLEQRRQRYLHGLHRRRWHDQGQYARCPKSQLSGDLVGKQVAKGTVLGLAHPDLRGLF